MNDGGGGGERRNRLPANPTILKNCVRPRTQPLIGAVRVVLITWHSKHQWNQVCSSPLPLPLQPFFCFRSTFRAITRLETLAAQATGGQGLLRLAQAWSLATFIWNIREIEWNENLRCSIPCNTTTMQPSYKVSLIHYFFIAGWLTSSAAQYIFAIVIGQLTEIF